MDGMAGWIRTADVNTETQGSDIAILKRKASEFKVFSK